MVDFFQYLTHFVDSWYLIHLAYFMYSTIGWSWYFTHFGSFSTFNTFLWFWIFDKCGWSCSFGTLIVGILQIWLKSLYFTRLVDSRCLIHSSVSCYLIHLVDSRYLTHFANPSDSLDLALLVHFFIYSIFGWFMY